MNQRSGGEWTKVSFFQGLQPNMNEPRICSFGRMGGKATPETMWSESECVHAYARAAVRGSASPPPARLPSPINHRVLSNLLIITAPACPSSLLLCHYRPAQANPLSHPDDATALPGSQVSISCLPASPTPHAVAMMVIFGKHNLDPVMLQDPPRPPATSPQRNIHFILRAKCQLLNLLKVSTH